MRGQMNKIFSRLGFVFLAMMFFLFIPDIQVQAEDLDKIENYTIELDNYDDGSLSIQYHIEWRVLDSTSEGPLTWIRVGIPNEYVEDITALSTSIDKIRYSSDDGDYVRIDLDRKYKAGEVVEIDFSIRQHRMYREHGAYYNCFFTPGWFEDMEIDEMEIRWKAYEGMSSEMPQENGYFVAREENLAHGQKIQVAVSYGKGTFQFQDDYDISAGRGNIYLQLLLAVGVPGVWSYYLLRFKPKQKDKDFYTVHSGMGHAYFKNHVEVKGGVRSHRSGCACACACACAGGGRAGCSVKEFYSAKKWSLRRAMEAGVK